MHIFDHISLISSQNKKCFGHNLQRKSRHILRSAAIFLNSCRLKYNVEKYGTARQTTDENILRRMRFAFGLTKASPQDTFPTRNIYSFATAILLKIRRCSVTLNVYCMFCYPQVFNQNMDVCSYKIQLYVPASSKIVNQSSSLCSFLHSPVTSSLLGPNILLSALFSNTLSLRPSVIVSDQVSHPYNSYMIHVNIGGTLSNSDCNE